MRILILGGTGAMGSYLVQLLSEQSELVCVTSRSKRCSSVKNIQYIQGDAHDVYFLKELLKEKYDVIVDFMVYNTQEFGERYLLFLTNTTQYVYLSSSRVYGDSLEPISENSKRLLDITLDAEYLKTDEYALTKARQEDLLQNSGKKNWTIIRPYITYGDERLQLGVYEKEAWLYRALHGRPIVFMRDIADKYTTITYGLNVAEGINSIINNTNALGEVFHITTKEYIKWSEILEIYVETIEKVTGIKCKVIFVDKAIENTYQIKVDRVYNRIFNNNKITGITNNAISYMSAREGLEICLTEFLQNEHKFGSINWKNEAKQDKIAKCFTPLDEIDSWKRKVKYMLYRYIL